MKPTTSILCALLCGALHVSTSLAWNRAGDLDPNFGAAGKVVLDRGSASAISAAAVAMQADGRIVIAGTYRRDFSDSDFLVVRFHPDGSLDSGFGIDGIVTTDFGGRDEGAAVAVQPDGRIVVAGRGGQFPDFAVARYNADGSLDSSFDLDGKFTLDFLSHQDLATAVAAQPDGRIVVFGAYDVGPAQVSGFGQFALTRLWRDGRIDISFGPGGKVYTDFGSVDVAWAGAVHDDGGIIAVGQFGCQGCNGTSFALAGYDSLGHLDGGFGTGGRVTTSQACELGVNSDIARGVAIQADGKIVVAGYSQRAGDDCRGSAFFVARYNRDGSLDTQFGAGGKVLSQFLSFTNVAQGIAIQGDGRILVAGYVATLTSETTLDYDFGLARYLPDGNLDPHFGSEGLAHADFGGVDLGRAVAIQADGKIVVVGSINGGVGMARFVPKGSIDDVEALLGDVEDLVDTGALADSDANGLRNKLEAVIKKLEKGHNGAAANQLSAFIDQVMELVDAGALSLTDGQKLIASAEAIIDEITGDVSKLAPNEDFSRASSLLVLEPNVPNPFQGTTRIQFRLPMTAPYEVSIYAVTGRRIRHYSGIAQLRETTIVWDGADQAGQSVGSGVYFCEVRAAGLKRTQRILLAR